MHQVAPHVQRARLPFLPKWKSRPPTWRPECAIVVAKCGETSSGTDDVVCWWLWLLHLSSPWPRRPIGIGDTELASAIATRRITECGMPGQMFWIDVED